MDSARDGGIAMSFSQVRHLKCIIGGMKALLVILLVTVTAQAQSIADAARKERERQAQVHSNIVIKEKGTTPAAAEQPAEPAANAPAAPATEGAKPADTKDLSKPKTPDPVDLWNAKQEELRAKIRNLQDQETALALQQTDIQNQVYAPVVDPVVKDQAQTALAQNQEKLAKVRDDLDSFRKELDLLQVAGPAKKN
jgi:type IV secretory pathway VirB10-like protein